MNGLQQLIWRDVVLGFRAGGGALQAVAFFLLVGVMFTLAIGPDLTLIEKIAAPVLWAAMLLATQISLDQIWRSDREDGSLDVLVETAEFLPVTAFVKSVAHWMATGLPLILVTPLLAILLNLPAGKLTPLIISLLIGAPGLSFIGCFAAALTVSLPRAHLLISVIVTPLYAPLLIFGMGAANAGAAGDPQYGANLMLLGAASLFAAIISPLASAAALRSNLD